jgi:hypothetical protein
MTTRMLGRYELLEQLGEGGMGAVFLARLTGAAGFEKLCIVKTVLPAIARDAEFVSRFLHEGRLLTQLSHGNIAQVLDLDEADGTLFLALEYVAGVDLSRLHEQVRAANERTPVEVVVALIAQAAEGLGAAHRKVALDGSPLQIVHRDVSPHNIMVSYEGEVKVIDFGIAKSEARSRHTAQASVLGKLGYMAPEQASGEAVDHRADQYALAIVAWELLSNQDFIPRGSLTEMVVAMANPRPRPLQPLRADVPPSLEAVVQRALSPRPGDRFATTDELAQALMGELVALGPPPTKPMLGQYVRARCAQEFAVTRQLLARVSTQRSPGPVMPGRTIDVFAQTTVRPAGEGPPALEHAPRPEATLVAPPAVTPLDRPVPAKAPPPPPLPMPAAERPLTTGELRAARPSRRPLFLGLAAALAGVLLIAAFLASSGGQDPARGPSSPGADRAAVPAAAEPGAVDSGAAVLVEAPLVDAGLAVVAPAPPVEEPPTLQLNGRRTSTSWILANAGRATWTQCRMTLPGQRVAEVGRVQRGSSKEVPFARFEVDPTAPALERQARLDCAEGFGLLRAP